MEREFRLDLIGQRFGRWLVLGDKGTGPRGEIWWKCRCDCGTERMVKARTLRSGESTSCGCYNRSVITKHGMEGTPIYEAWSHMIQRCENPKNKHFHDYGGRGITVCPEWRADFQAFFRDMGEKPSPTHSLGREDNAGNYEPTNCRWETQKQQMRNRRTTKWLEFQGERRPLGEWAEIKAIPPKVLKDRLNRKWTIDEALTTPYPSGTWVRRRA